MLHDESTYSWQVEDGLSGVAQLGMFEDLLLTMHRLVLGKPT